MELHATGARPDPKGLGAVARAAQQLDRGAQQRRLGGEARLATDVKHRLLATEGEDPVDLGELGQRVVATDVALVEHDAGAAQNGVGVPAEGAPEVVQDGDDGCAHAPPSVATLSSRAAS